MVREPVARRGYASLIAIALIAGAVGGGVGSWATWVNLNAERPTAAAPVITQPPVPVTTTTAAPAVAPAAIDTQAFVDQLGAIASNAYAALTPVQKERSKGATKLACQAFYKAEDDYNPSAELAFDNDLTVVIKQGFLSKEDWMSSLVYGTIDIDDVDKAVKECDSHGYQRG